MEYRPLNLTLLSAEGIKNVHSLFSKMDAYADVSFAGFPLSLHRTPVHKNSGTNPHWYCSMEFIVDEPYLTQPGLSLLFEIKVNTAFARSKLVGVVTVPIHELFQSTASDPAADRCVEYQVSVPSGSPKGTLKFCYHFGEKFTKEGNRAPEALATNEYPTTAYPPAAGGYPPQYPAPVGYPPQYPPPPPGYYPQYQAYPPYYPPAGYAQPSGYGYPPAKTNGMGMGMGMGMAGLALGAGLLGGLAVGEMVEGVGEAAAYADGYGDAIGDMDLY